MACNCTYCSTSRIYNYNTIQLLIVTSWNLPYCSSYNNSLRCSRYYSWHGMTVAVTARAAKNWPLKKQRYFLLEIFRSRVAWDIDHHFCSSGFATRQLLFFWIIRESIKFVIFFANILRKKLREKLIPWVSMGYIL